MPKYASSTKKKALKTVIFYQFFSTEKTIICIYVAFVYVMDALIAYFSIVFMLLSFKQKLIRFSCPVKLSLKI